MKIDPLSIQETFFRILIDYDLKLKSEFNFENRFDLDFPQIFEVLENKFSKILLSRNDIIKIADVGFDKTLKILSKMD